MQESTPTSLLAKSLPVQKHGVSAILYLCYLSWQNNTFTQKILQAKQMRSVGFYREFLTERQRFEDSHKEWLSLLLLPELTPNSPTSTTNSSASKTTSSANKSGASAPFTPLKRSNSLIVSPTSSSRTTTPSFATSSSRNTPIHSSNNAIANLQTEIRNSTFFKINKNDLRSQITWIFQQIEKEIEIAWNRQQGSDEALVDIEKIEKMERFKEQLQRESEQMEDLLQAFSKSSEPSDSKSTAVVDEKGVAIQQNDDLPLAVNKKGTDEEAGEYLHPSEHPALLLCEQDMDISFHEIS